MRLLFRANASRGEKVYTLSFLAFTAVVIFGCCYGGFGPSDRLYSLAPYLAIPGSMAFLVPLVLDRHPANKLPTYGSIKRFSVYVMIFLLSYLFALVGIAIGLPAVATHFFGERFAGEYKVVAKGDGRFRLEDSCSWYEMHLRNLAPAPARDIKVCAGRALWEAIKVGDIVNAIGHQTRLGVHLEKFEQSGR